MELGRAALLAEGSKRGPGFLLLFHTEVGKLTRVRAAAQLLGKGPRREACESCCCEKPRSMLHDASYLANAGTVSPKWLSRSAQ